jgi:hypothetical protein
LSSPGSSFKADLDVDGLLNKLCGELPDVIRTIVGTRGQSSGSMLMGKNADISTLTEIIRTILCGLGSAVSDGNFINTDDGTTTNEDAVFLLTSAQGRTEYSDYFWVTSNWSKIRWTVVSDRDNERKIQLAEIASSVLRGLLKTLSPSLQIVNFLVDLSNERDANRGNDSSPTNEIIVDILKLIRFSVVFSSDRSELLSIRDISNDLISFLNVTKSPAQDIIAQILALASINIEISEFGTAGEHSIDVAFVQTLNRSLCNKFDSTIALLDSADNQRRSVGGLTGSLKCMEAVVEVLYYSQLQSSKSKSTPDVCNAICENLVSRICKASHESSASVTDLKSRVRECSLELLAMLYSKNILRLEHSVLGESDSVSAISSATHFPSDVSALPLSLLHLMCEYKRYITSSPSVDFHSSKYVFCACVSALGRCCQSLRCIDGVLDVTDEIVLGLVYYE